MLSTGGGPSAFVAGAADGRGSVAPHVESARFGAAEPTKAARVTPARAASNAQVAAMASDALYVIDVDTERPDDLHVPVAGGLEPSSLLNLLYAQ